MGRVTYSRAARRRVIAVFRQTGFLTEAFKAIGADRSRHYDWLSMYPDYKADYEAARPEVADIVEEEVKARALVGWDEPVFHGGKRAMDFARDAQGNPILQDCGVCKGTGKAADQAGHVGKCAACGGSGKGKQFAAVPAVIRKKSDACLLALASARVPGFGQKTDHRLVDKKGDDLLGDVAAVRAYMKSCPDED